MEIRSVWLVLLMQIYDTAHLMTSSVFTCIYMGWRAIKSNNQIALSFLKIYYIKVFSEYVN